MRSWPAFTFTDPKIKAAATRIRRSLPHAATRHSLGHTIGMEVHDVGRRGETLQPGHDVHDRAGHADSASSRSACGSKSHPHHRDRLREMSAFVPVEIDEIEKLMKEPGLGWRSPGGL